MSQEKVDRYKKEKANRKTILKKEKRKSILTKILGSVVCLGLIAWVGISGFRAFKENQPIVQTEVNLSALDNYMSELDTATTQDSAATDTTEPAAE